MSTSSSLVKNLIHTAAMLAERGDPLSYKDHFSEYDYYAIGFVGGLQEAQDDTKSPAYPHIGRIVVANTDLGESELCTTLSMLNEAAGRMEKDETHGRQLGRIIIELARHDTTKQKFTAHASLSVSFFEDSEDSETYRAALEVQIDLTGCPKQIVEETLDTLYDLEQQNLWAGLNSYGRLNKSDVTLEDKRQLRALTDFIKRELGKPEKIA